jgi:hypothetical protein
MYHDEFARKPVKPVKSTPYGEDALPSLPLEVGGGLSLGLAASLNLPISMLLFYLGGLLPLVTCCLAIAAQRVSDFLVGLAPGLETRRPSAVPVPHIFGSSSRMGAAQLRNQRARSGR